MLLSLLLMGCIVLLGGVVLMGSVLLLGSVVLLGGVVVVLIEEGVEAAEQVSHVSDDILYLIDLIAYSMVIGRHPEHSEVREAIALDRHSLLLLLLFVLHLPIHLSLVVHGCLANQEGLVIRVLTTGLGRGGAAEGLVRVEAPLGVVIFVVLPAEPHHSTLIFYRLPASMGHSH